MIVDGDYDVIVVDAHELDDGARQIELAFTSGDRRGETVSLIARGLCQASVDLLGMPATLRVQDGAPRLEWH